MSLQASLYYKCKINHILLGTEMTTSELFRRDPQKGENGFPAQKGFTVIELMIAVGVLAVVISLALPSYQAIIEKRQVTRGAEEVAAFLSQAKAQAVKLNEDVAVSYASGDDWCLGFSNGTDACNCSNPAASNYCKIEYDYDRDGTVDASEERVFQSSLLHHPEVMSGIAFRNQGGTALGGTPVIVYDSVRGMVEVSDASAEAASASLALVSTGGKYALNVEIDRLGRVSICSPQSDDHSQVPGYDTCAQ
jgi:prepilin-type N-terminal cleavage/methylation domain-containing protein